MAGTRLKEYLTDIADAIRTKTFKSALMTVPEMPGEVDGIPYPDIEDSLITGTITEYTNDRVTYTRQAALRAATNLITVNLPYVTYINTQLLYGCTAIKNVNIPNATAIAAQSLQLCRDLEYVHFPKVLTIAGSTFQQSGLTVLNLYDPDRTAIPTLSNLNALSQTPIADGNGYIVINDSMVDELKAANNWSSYASQIIGNSDAAALGLIEGGSEVSPVVPPPAPVTQNLNPVTLDRDPIELEPVNFNQEEYSDFIEELNERID